MWGLNILPKVRKRWRRQQLPTIGDAAALSSWLQWQIEALMAEMKTSVDGASIDRHLLYLRQIDQWQQIERWLMIDQAPTQDAAPRQLPLWVEEASEQPEKTWTYLMDTGYLREVRDYVLQGEPEWMVAASGPRADKHVVLDRMVGITEYDKQSPTSAKATTDAILAALYSFDEQGMALNGLLHSHRWSGRQSPSGRDKEMARILDSGGYTVIQAIFSEDGYITFFAGQHPFEVHISGKGVARVDQTIWKLD